MTQIKFVNSLVIVSAILLSSVSVQAASQCKGLDNSACDANAACGWVDSYVRKDGREVSAFCRTSNKGKPKLSKASEVSKKPA